MTISPLRLSGNARLGIVPLRAFKTMRFLTGVLSNVRKEAVPKRAFPVNLPHPQRTGILYPRAKNLAQTRIPHQVEPGKPGTSPDLPPNRTRQTRNEPGPPAKPDQANLARARTWHSLGPCVGLRCRICHLEILCKPEPRVRLRCRTCHDYCIAACKPGQHAHKMKMLDPLERKRAAMNITREY